VQALITFLDGDKPIARHELRPGMVAPVEGQLVLLSGNMWQVTRVVVDFTPSIPDCSQVILCRLRKFDSGAARTPR
jgi:hypothetical protein